MRHVVWDWNGTLLDDIHLVVAAVNDALDEPRALVVDVELYRTHYTRPVHHFYERILGRVVQDEEWPRIDERYHAAYRTGLARAELAPDALLALRAVDDAGLTQSLLSMWRHEELVPLVLRFGLDAHLVRVDGLRGAGGGQKALHLEQHLEHLDAHLEHGLRPGEVLVVGDTLDDAAAAAHVGARCVLYDGGSHHRHDLARAGVPVADSLLDALVMGGCLPEDGGIAGA